MKRIKFGALMLLGVLSVPGSLLAKGQTVRLTIAGASLRQPIDVSAKGALANVWAGVFIGAAASEPDTALPRFVVSFWVKANRSVGPATVKYKVTYVPDPASGSGYVYLPGPSEPDAVLNQAAIIRHRQDGRWHRASIEWSRALNAQLAAAR